MSKAKHTAGFIELTLVSTTEGINPDGSTRYGTAKGDTVRLDVSRLEGDR